MTVSYKRLWKLLIDRGMLKKDLKESAGLSPYVMAQLRHDRNINTQILCSICRSLGCGIEDIVEFIPDEKE
ncbi:MAG: helix-turn-helix transcriptional regulator [Oscillospiraceae bacterium]|nr:helix-turn-helix transcriptional regulator [Oscillospiraceae bacterium]